MNEAMTFNKHQMTPAEVIAMRDKLAEVIRNLRFDDTGCWAGGIDCTESVTDHAEDIAHAVVEFLRERHEPDYLKGVTDERRA